MRSITIKERTSKSPRVPRAGAVIIKLDKRLNGLFVTALNSDDLRVRAAAIELNLAALDLKKTSATVDGLEPDARSGAQGPRANALWRIGLLGNRGIEPDRAFRS